MKVNYLEKLREGQALSFAQQLHMVFQLSLPAILAQVSVTVMEYIDASMVGQLGANDSAAIGLISSTTWLMNGLCSAINTGFSVRIAHRIGAKDDAGARNLVKMGLLVAIAFSLIMLGIGCGISHALPIWLGGNEDITAHASTYFFIYALSLPIYQLNNAAIGMLQCSGNMRVPSIMQVVACVLDVIFNYLLIFSGLHVTVGSVDISIPGAGLGIMGAALGTLCAEAVSMVVLVYLLLMRSSMLRLRSNEKLVFSLQELVSSGKISIPVAIETAIMCSAYVIVTKIVAPLGTISIAANSFCVTAEGLCYMPGYGIGVAATTIMGQALGANRKDLMKRLGSLTIILGVLVMTAMGAVMYCCAPFMIGLLTPDPDIRALGIIILRIEALAEPLYGASIICSGVFRGLGNTVIPSILNFACMWCIRIPLMLHFAPISGITGVWKCMRFELCCRGILFLVFLWIYQRRKLRGLTGDASIAG